MTDEEVKDLVTIHSSEYFRSIRGKQNLRKVAKSIYLFLTTPDEVQSKSSDDYIHHYNFKSF